MRRSKAGEEPHKHIEYEIKLALADAKTETQSRSDYRRIFKEIMENKKRFPDRSGIAGEPDARRSFTARDQRVRYYLSDAGLLISRSNWEIRHDVTHNALMIKHGAAANGDNHTLRRSERKYRLIKPHIGTVSEIESNSECGRKAPKSLREQFKNAVLYPMIRAESLRDKLVYYRSAVYQDRAYIVALELAQDEGHAAALGRLEPYAIDQIELEVKSVIDARSGIDVLEYPNKVVPPLTLDDLRNHIIKPVLAREEEWLSETYGLAPVFDSKPTKGFEQLYPCVGTDSYKKAIDQARAAYEQQNGAYWKKHYSALREMENTL